MRKLGFGILWFIAFLFGTLITGGAIMGAMAGASDPANASDAGYNAGLIFGQQYGGLIFIGSLLVSVVGSIMGWLPGTISKKY